VAAHNPTPPAPAAPAAGEDPHAALCRRMAELEQERQGRWQKILNFVKRT
jgi:hypothetical protein